MLPFFFMIMDHFPSFFRLARHSFKVAHIHRFAYFTFSGIIISNLNQHNPRGNLLSYFHFDFKFNFDIKKTKLFSKLWTNFLDECSRNGNLIAGHEL